MEFTSIFLNKICKIGKKNVSRQKLVGFPAIFKKKSWERVVGHELPWSRAAMVTRCSYTLPGAIT